MRTRSIRSPPRTPPHLTRFLPWSPRAEGQGEVNGRALAVDWSVPRRKGEKPAPVPFHEALSSFRYGSLELSRWQEKEKTAYTFPEPQTEGLFDAQFCLKRPQPMCDLLVHCTDMPWVVDDDDCLPLFDKEAKLLKERVLPRLGLMRKDPY